MATLLRESKASPSTFATILRRSKFASYDPRISQIYTTYDGHAHRGNWGFKRPLALRRKTGGFIVVKSVDSREQQTEWDRAEQEARWMNSFSELGKDVELKQDGSWHENMGRTWMKTFDSDYHLKPDVHTPYGPNIIKEHETGGWQSTGFNRLKVSQVPNPNSLNPKEFRGFLKRLRNSHGRFKSFVEEKRRLDEDKQKSAHQTHRPTNIVANFLPWDVAREFADPRSKRLLPSPHHNAALSYSHASDLTNRFLYHAVPGRIFSYATTGSRPDQDVMKAGVAGILGDINVRGRKPTKLSDQEGLAKPVQVRARSLYLSEPPRAVNSGTSSGFRESSVLVTLVPEDVLTKKLTNSFIPGSQKYVEHNDPTQLEKTKSSIMRTNSQARKFRGGRQTRDRLKRANEMLSNVSQNRRDFSFRLTEGIESLTR